MSVVLSVRLDPVSARRVAALADGEHRTPSALVREWVLEHLANSGTVLKTRAIGEARPNNLEPVDDFEVLRQEHRPPTIKMLMVGESRPAGGTFFYLANSNLYFATREAFARARGSAAYGEEFLHQLQQEGVWLYDVAPSPVNQLAGRPRREAGEARSADLVGLLRQSNPAIVVAIKRSLEPIVRTAMDAAGTSLDRLVTLPFPLYQWREDYVAGLARVFGSRHATGAEVAVAQGDVRNASGARDRGRAGVTQPVTPNDLASGQIRIPKAAKGLLPDRRSSVTVLLRGNRLDTSYDPRNGPDRSRSGVLRIPRPILRASVHPHEQLRMSVASGVVDLS